MTSYILRRLLLVLPTLLGISIACFTLMQFVPGGPVEEYISKMRESASSRGKNAIVLSPDEIENIKAAMDMQGPAVERYFRWLGRVLQGNLGDSLTYHRPVLDVIASKMPISLFFGLTSFFLSYLVSIPLGLVKAVWNNGRFDTISSILLFIGYVMPGFALGILLVIFFGGGSFLNWFPISGIVSDNFNYLSPPEKILDFLHHMVLPLICYMIGDFTLLTLLTKNSVLEELNKDYVRTALAKGVPFHRTVWKHALRNSLIPLATGMGSIFTVMFAGALLIERVFDLDGMGLLFYNSILSRDYAVVMGSIVLISFFAILGRLFSDILYVIVDPRIRLD